MLARLAPELARLIPDLAPIAPLEPKAERHRIFAAFAGLLEDLAGRLPEGCPVILALEDLHWSDPTTLQAVHYLQRSCAAARIAVFATYRAEDAEPGGLLAQLVERLREGGRAATLEVRCLDGVQTDLLIAHLLAPHPAGDAVRALIAERARGNPLFVRELMASLRLSGALALRDGVWHLADASLPLLPTSIQTLFLDRVRHLDEDAMRLARVCAVIGQDAHYLVVREAGNLDEETLLDALETLLDAGLLEETEAAPPHGAEVSYPTYRVHHPLFREALYQQIPAPRRMHLHRRAAEALERWYAEHAAEHAAALAWQFGRAGLHAPATHYAVLAGDQAAAAAAFPEAQAHYQAALQHLAHRPAFDETPYAAPTPGVVEEKVGDLRLLAGDYAAAQETFSQARSGETDPTRRAELWRKEAVSWERRGDFDRALALLDAADAEGLGLDGLPVAARARLALGRCHIHTQRGTYETASVTARRVVELARQAGDQQLSAEAHQVLGDVSMHQHRLADADAHYAQALAIWERDATNPLVQRDIARSLMGLGNVSYLRRDRASAEACLRRALAVNERIGNASGTAACWNNLGNNAFAGGAFTAARDCYRRGFDLKERLGDHYRVGHGWNNLGGVALALGDLAEAETCFQRSLALQEGTGSRAMQGVCRQNLGDVALARGDLAGADERFRQALDLLEGSGMAEAIAGALVGRAAVARARGEPWAAAALARRARRLACRHRGARGRGRGVHRGGACPSAHPPPARRRRAVGAGARARRHARTGAGRPACGAARRRGGAAARRIHRGRRRGRRCGASRR